MIRVGPDEFLRCLAMSRRVRWGSALVGRVGEDGGALGGERESNRAPRAKIRRQGMVRRLRPKNSFSLAAHAVRPGRQNWAPCSQNTTVDMKRHRRSGGFDPPTSQCARLRAVTRPVSGLFFHVVATGTVCVLYNFMRTFVSVIVC